MKSKLPVTSIYICQFNFSILTKYVKMIILQKMHKLKTKENDYEKYEKNYFAVISSHGFDTGRMR